MSARSRPRRVLFVSSSYPFHRLDVHALFVHAFARALIDAGHEVSVLTPCTPQTRDRSERWDGVDVERFTYPGLSRAPITGLGGLLVGLRARPQRSVVVPGLVAAMARHTQHAVDRLRPDLVVAHWLVPTGLAVALAQGWARPRCPVVHLAHSSDVHLLARLPGGRVIGRMLARNGVIAATSGYLAERLRAAGIAPNAAIVPLGAPQLSVAARTTAPARLRVCTMGRLVQGKGIERLLDVAVSAPDLAVTIAGEGPQAARIDAEIARRGLSGRVARRGFVLGAEKASFFAAHDVFAFIPDTPAPDGFQDNLPVVVLEALAHGVPVVATRVGAVPELLSGGSGALVGDAPSEVAGAIRALCAADSYPRASQAALGCARQRSWRASVDALLGLYDPSEVAAFDAPHQDLA